MSLRENRELEIDEMGGCNQSKVGPASAAVGSIQNKSFSFWKLFKKRRNTVRVSHCLRAHHLPVDCTCHKASVVVLAQSWILQCVISFDKFTFRRITQQHSMNFSSTFSYASILSPPPTPFLKKEMRKTAKYTGMERFNIHVFFGLFILFIFYYFFY